MAISMTNSFTLGYDFTQASTLLHNLVLQIETDIHAINKSSSEMYTTLREKLNQTWQDWPSIKENFKEALNNLPTELRKRDFVHATIKELEHFEENAKHIFSRLSEQSHRSPRLSAQEQIARMQEYTGHFRARIVELTAHPLMEKFTKGETILASRSKTQWARKTGHMLCGLTFAYLFRFSGLPEVFVQFLFGSFLIWGLALETARHLNPKINAWVCRAFRPVMREREKDKINSGIFFMLSMLVVYLIFPLDVTFLTLLFISLGDPIAGIIGVRFGKHKLTKHSSIEGVAACFALCTFMAYICGAFFFTEYHLSGAALLMFSLLAGAVAAIAESTFKIFDDNLTMPLLSAPGIWFLLQLF